MDEETSPVLPTRKGHSQGSSQVSQPRRSPSRWCVLRWAVCALQRCAVSLICSMHMELSGKCAGMWKPSCPVSPLVTVSVFTPVFLHLGISTASHCSPVFALHAMHFMLDFYVMKGRVKTLDVGCVCDRLHLPCTAAAHTARVCLLFCV